MRLCLLIPAVVALSGCGPRYVWVKNVNHSELMRDRYECERDARAAVLSFGTGIIGQLNAEEFMGLCFQAKGYTLQAVSDAPAALQNPGPLPTGTPDEWRRDQRYSCNASCDAKPVDVGCYDQCARDYPLPEEH